MRSVSNLVVDASVVCNRLLEQGWSVQARAVFTSGMALLAPTLARQETASALSVAVRARLISQTEAIERFESVGRLPIEFVNNPNADLAALRIALETGLSPYDAVYIALALIEDAGLATADREQSAVAREACGMGSRVVWLGDI